MSRRPSTGCPGSLGDREKIVFRSYQLGGRVAVEVGSNVVTFPFSAAASLLTQLAVAVRDAAVSGIRDKDDTGVLE